MSCDSENIDFSVGFITGLVVGGLIFGVLVGLIVNQRWEYGAMRSGAGGWEWVEGSGKTWVWKTGKVGGK